MTLETLIDQGHKVGFDSIADLLLASIDKGGHLIINNIVDHLIKPAVAQNAANVRGDAAERNDTIEIINLNGTKDEGHLVLEGALYGQILQCEAQRSGALIAHR